MSKLIKVKEEIERIPIEEIVFGEEILVDPRDYEISDFNPRIIEPTRNMKILEDSILESGFLAPALSDENKKLLDGGRRWRIAIKHGIKFKVIHRKYGDDTNADVNRIIDAIMFNVHEGLTPKELGLIYNRLLDISDLPIREIGRRTGYPINRISQFLQEVTAPEKIPEEDVEKVEEMWDKLTPTEKQRAHRISQYKGVQDVKAIVEDFKEMDSYREQEEYEKDIKEQLPIDRETRVEFAKQKEVELWSLRIDLKTAQKFKSKVRRRNQDRIVMTKVLLRGYAEGLIDVPVDVIEQIKEMLRE